MSWDDFCKSVKKTASRAADKINQTADLATLQVKLSLAEHKLNEAYAALGEVAYQHFSSEDSQVDGITAAMGGVEAALTEVNNLKKQIEDTKVRQEAKEEQKEDQKEES